MGVSTMTEYTVEQLIKNHEKAFQPEKAMGLDAIIQYHLTGEEGGDWIITIRDDKCTVQEGIAENPKMTLTADAREFRDILLGKMDGMAAFMQGKLKLSGDLNLAMKLTSFFRMK
jgi:putative sterol carrier protein